MTAVNPPHQPPHRPPLGRLRLLAEMAAALGHDLGQPLNGIRLAAEAAADRLHRGDGDLVRLTRSLEAIAGQSRRLQDMIDHLSAMARQPDRPVELFSSVEAVRRALAGTLPRLAAENIRLRWHADLPPPLVLGHSDRLEAAVASLLANACDAITAAALARDPTAEPAGSLDVACQRHDGGVRITVEDDGHGFPPNVLAGLGPSAPPFPDGHRIGLTIAAGVVAEMDGDLAAVNRDRGARVEISLPGFRG